MSDEKHNDNLLVDQNEALDFYFDSMLLPDKDAFADEDNDSLTDESDSQDQNGEIAEKKTAALSAAQDAIKKQQSQENQEEINPLEQLQSAKDFLQISKQRQQNNSAQVIKSESKAKAEPELNKPEFRVTELVSKQAESTQSIVFSNKKDDGKVSSQVLIPRSRRLAELKQKTHSDSVSESQKQSVNRTASKIISTDKKTADNTVQSNHDSTAFSGSAKNIPLETNNTASQVMPLEKESVREIEAKNYAQEAPNLDLSLFLPKIKTLSDTEIAQQIEALTQAAVKAQLEQVSQQVIKTTQAEADDGPIRNIDNAPSWAVPNFQVLLFAVAGLKMAVPLSELNGIVEWGDDYITELPGHKPWYLGIIQNQGKNVPVIDTLQQVVPKNRWPADHLNKKNFKHIILIDNSRWGLACETVLEVVTLKTDSVKWRSSRTKRRWLLGTVIEHMCALLDSSEFAAMLKTGDDSLVS